MLKTTNVLSHTVSEGQESRSGSLGWFWLRVCHEVTVKVLAGTASSEGWIGAGGPTSKLTHMPVVLVT